MDSPYINTNSYSYHIIDLSTDIPITGTRNKTHFTGYGNMERQSRDKEDKRGLYSSDVTIYTHLSFPFTKTMHQLFILPHQDNPSFSSYFLVPVATGTSKRKYSKFAFPENLDYVINDWTLYYITITDE